MNWFIVHLVLFTPPSPDPAYYQAQLAVDRWASRERATQTLIRYGTRALPTARKLQKHKDPEVRFRAGVAIEQIRMNQLRQLEPFPFIDSLYYDRKTHLYRMAGPLGEWTGVAAPYVRLAGDSGLPFTSYRTAARAYANDLLEARVPLWAIKLFFIELRKRDEDFLRNVRKAPAQGGPAVMPPAGE